MNPNIIDIASGAIRDLRPAPKNKADELRQVLNENNLGVEDVVRSLRSIIYTADKDADKLRATELAAKMHGLLQEDKVSQVPVININIQGNADIDAVLVP